jgi:hypothetical protein
VYRTVKRQEEFYPALAKMLSKSLLETRDGVNGVPFRCSFHIEEFALRHGHLTRANLIDSSALRTWKRFFPQSTILADSGEKVVKTTLVLET